MRAIGLDIGTTTLSAVVVDASTGTVERALTVPNDACIAAEPWARIQDAEKIWRRAQTILAELTADYPNSLCIGLTGQMHGIVYVDAAGRAVSPLFTWQDGRGELPFDAEAGDGDSYAAVLSRRTGHSLATGYGALTHAWHCLNGCVPEKAAGFTTIHGYIGMRLTGRTTLLLHASDAAGLGAYDIATRRFDTAALERAGVDASLFPPVTADTVMLGRTRAESLPAGLAVSVAIGDNQASFLGAVRHPAETILVNIGTGGQVSMASDAWSPLTECEVRPCADGGFIMAGISLCGGRSYALLESFLREVALLAGAPNAPLYAAMNALAERAETLSDPLRICTRFDGTRRQPELRGSIENIGVHNFTPAHLAAGVIEGMVGELHALQREMLPYAKQPPTALVGSGNGIRRNPALRRACSRAFGLELQMPLHTEEAAYGAALFSMAAAGLYPSVSAAQRLIRYAQ